MRKTFRKRVQRSPFVITVAVAIAAGSCGGKAFDDTEASGGTGAQGGSGGNAGKGGSAGKSGSGGKGGSAGTSSSGGAGGGSECPTSMPGFGTACAMEGQVCSYPNGPCCPPYEMRCVGGTWSGSISSCNPPPPLMCPTNPPYHGDPCSLDPCSGPPTWQCHYGTCADGTPQLVATCNGSSWSLLQNACPSMDGGSVCDPIERQLVEFANANRACQTTSDCRIVVGPCANGADYCDGSFFVNKNIDQSKWNGLANELQDCMLGSSSGCAVCDGIPPPPACVGGKCQGS